MAENRMLSLNDVSDFSVEDLEPRMEMQILGLASNIIHFHGSDHTTITTAGGRHF